MIGIRITLPEAVLVYDQKAARKAMAAAGREIAAVARMLASSRSGGGRVYRGGGGGVAGGWRPYRKGRYQASAAGQAPAKVTGTLAKSIRSTLFKRGIGVWIHGGAFYAKMLEVGSRGGVGSGHRGVDGTSNVYRKRQRVRVAGSRTLEPRPFLDLALEQRGESAGERVREAVLQGIAFRKMKARP